MTRLTRDGTDAATAAKILAGLRERVSRLEKEDQQGQEMAFELAVHTDSASTEDTAVVEIEEVIDPGGFGLTPFGSTFGDPFGSGTTETEVIGTRTVENTTTSLYHQFVAAVTRPTPDVPARPEQIALGDGTGEFTASNTSLHNRLGAVDIIEDSSMDGGQTAVLHAQVPTQRFVGETIRELGIETSDGDLLTHAELSPGIAKTNDLRISVEYRIRTFE